MIDQIDCERDNLHRKNTRHRRNEKAGRGVRKEQRRVEAFHAYNSYAVLLP